MTILLPRISSADAFQSMNGFRGMGITQIASQADSSLDRLLLRVKYAAVGGVRIGTEQLIELRRELRAIAETSGYPNRVERDGQQRFDRDISLYLRTFPALQGGEAIRAETWQFVAAGLVPDLVFWRFAPDVDRGPVTAERYLGGNRNCFGRLWQRAVVFWDDRLSEPGVPLTLLKEDNVVAILERSAFSAFAAPCREAARAFLLRRHLARDQQGKSLEERLLRDAMCRVVRVTGYAALWAVDDAELQDCIARLFDASLGAIGIKPVAEDELVRRQPSLELIKKRSGGMESRAPTPVQESTDSSVQPFVPQASTSSNLQAPLFETMSYSKRTNVVWQILIGHGEAPQEDLVRLAAHELKNRGQLSFERLREGGYIYKLVEDAIERGVRIGRFDKPSRGCRRAIATVEELPLPVVEAIVRERLSEGLPEDHALPLLVSELCRLVGAANRVGMQQLVDMTLSDLRSSGRLVISDGLMVDAAATPDKTMAADSDT